MPVYSGINSGMMDEMSPFDNSPDWSIYKATSLLSDSISLYDDTEVFSHSELHFSNHYEIPTKMIKSEPMTELLPVEVQHYGDWQSKCIDHWVPQDCLFWLINELQDLHVDRTLPEVKMEKFAHISGDTLKHMTVEDFRQLFPEHGFELFSRLQKFKVPANYYMDQWNNTPLQGDDCYSRYQCSPQEPHTLTDLDSETCITSFNSNTGPFCPPSESESGYKSDSSVETTIEQPPPPEKRRPGRPRGTRKKKKPEKLGRLWEFIRDLLLNPMYNPSLICWENYEEGTFRFVHSDRVAKLWGSKKDNVDMNYEKLSRAMRYYYKSQVLLPVYGKRLVYKFGPTATGWRSERPIFRQG